MKTKILFALLFVTGMSLVFFDSCKKDSDSNPTSAKNDTVVDINGNVYNTITVGSKVWMTKNLNVTKYNTGTAISNVTTATSWSKLTTAAYCNYNNDESYASTYGRIYNWYAASKSNIAPKGWHVATKEEWEELIDSLGNNSKLGRKLNFLPGGSRGNTGSYGRLHSGGMFWASTVFDTDNGYFINFVYSGTILALGSSNKLSGGYIRCVKN